MSPSGSEAWDLLGGAFCLRWSMTMLHFLWQGTAVYLLVLAAGRVLRERSAGAKYSLHAIALLSLPVCLMVTFVGLEVPPSSLAFTDATGVTAVDSAGDRERYRSLEGGTSITQDMTGIDAGRGQSPIHGDSLLSLSRLAPLLTGVYLAGLLYFVLRLAVVTWSGHCLRAHSLTLEDPRIGEVIVEQARKIGLRFVPLAVRCEEVAVPAVVGILRPVLLLPGPSLTGLTAEQFAIVVAHELAHIRRFDLAMNFAQRVIESLLFFHPAVWYISRKMSEQREACCDDLVVSSGSKPTECADALLRMAELCTQGAGCGSVALAASGNGYSGFELRIRRLLAAGEGAPQRHGRLSVVGFVLLLGCVVLTPVITHRWVHAAVGNSSDLLRPQSEWGPDRQAVDVEAMREEGIGGLADTRPLGREGDEATGKGVKGGVEHVAARELPDMASESIVRSDPDPSGSTGAGWEIVCPDETCRIEGQAGSKLTISVPATNHDLNPRRRMNAPRVLKRVAGDFTVQVKVTADFTPGDQSTGKGKPFNGAGLLIWGDENNFLRLERNAYRSSGLLFCYPPLIEHWRDGKYAGVNASPMLAEEFFEGRSTWLKLQRQGKRMTASFSHDGEEWSVAKEFSVEFAEEVSVGVQALNTSNAPFSVEFEEFGIADSKALNVDESVDDVAVGPGVDVDSD